MNDAGLLHISYPSGLGHGKKKKRRKKKDNLQERGRGGPLTRLHPACFGPKALDASMHGAWMDPDYSVLRTFERVITSLCKPKTIPPG